MRIPVEVSARHIHLSKSDFQMLFGDDKELTVLREISQPNHFAANETVVLRGPKGQIEKVRIIGPFRDQTQIEVAVSDCRRLGIKPYFAVSGNLINSPGGITVSGPTGKVDLEKGVIVALPHLHASPSQARQLGLKHLDRVTIAVRGDRPVSFHDIVVRSRQGIDELAFHIDVDQANAVGSFDKATPVSYP